jgi:hypothetical protein
MHTFPPSSKLQFLIGKELAQISLDPNSVQFRWSESGQITAQFDFEHIDGERNAHRYDCTAFNGPPLLLHRLIGRKVQAVEVEELCLTLVFDDGQLLRLWSEEGPYECGLIQFTNNLADGCIVY